MSEAPQTGGLLFTILCAEKRIWNVRDVSNLYLFEHALLAVPTTLGEMVEGASKKRTPEEWDAWLAGKRSAVEAGGARDSAELLSRPDTRLVPWTAVTRARLRKGWLESRLALELNDGTTVKWLWMCGDGFRGKNTPNLPFADAEAALRQILGSALTLR